MKEEYIKEFLIHWELKRMMENSLRVNFSKDITENKNTKLWTKIRRKK